MSKVQKRKDESRSQSHACYDVSSSSCVLVLLGLLSLSEVESVLFLKYQLLLRQYFYFVLHTSNDEKMREREDEPAFLYMMHTFTFFMRGQEKKRCRNHREG